MQHDENRAFVFIKPHANTPLVAAPVREVDQQRIGELVRGLARGSRLGAHSRIHRSAHSTSSSSLRPTPGPTARSAPS